MDIAYGGHERGRCDDTDARDGGQTLAGNHGEITMREPAWELALAERRTLTMRRFSSQARRFLL